MFEHAMKLKVRMIVTITIVQSFTREHITHLLPLALLLVLCTRNNTDDNMQTRDILRYSFVLWSYLHNNIHVATKYMLHM